MIIYGEPVAIPALEKKFSETWILNSRLATGTLPNTTINFNCEGVKYKQIYAEGTSVTYVQEDGAEVVVYMMSWNGNYQTVEFTQEIPGTLLTWLQDNGTKQ